MPFQLLCESITPAQHKIIANPVLLKSDDALKPAPRGVRTIREGTSHVHKFALLDQYKYMQVTFLKNTWLEYLGTKSV